MRSMRAIVIAILVGLAAIIATLLSSGVAAANTGFPVIPSSAIVTPEETVMQPGGDINWDAARNYTSIDQMKQYAAAIETSVSNFDRSVGQQPPAVWHFIPSGKFIAACGDHQPEPSSVVYYYCPDDDGVYMGEDMMWDLYHQSWIAPAVAIAHETGHAMQQQHGANSGDMSWYVGPSSQIGEEDQADCVAGSYAMSVEPLTHIGITDVPGILDMWQAAGGDPNDSERDHGTFLERLGASASGAFTGIGSCNAIGHTPVTN